MKSRYNTLIKNALYSGNIEFVEKYGKQACALNFGICYVAVGTLQYDRGNLKAALKNFTKVMAVVIN